MDLSRRQAIAAIAAVAGASMPGCGYILYPERKGTAAGDLDGGVVVMDALLCLLFLIPGVIAFAVDVSTGCIYLPSSKDGQPRMARRRVGIRTKRSFETALSRELGVRVWLDDPRMQVVGEPMVLDAEILAQARMGHPKATPVSQWRFEQDAEGRLIGFRAEA